MGGIEITLSRNKREEIDEELGARIDFLSQLWRPQYEMPKELGARIDFLSQLWRPQYTLPNDSR